MTVASRAARIMLMTLIAGSSALAQGKNPKTPAKWPGTADFRCSYVVGIVSCPPGVDPDGILGDGSTYALVNDADGTAGAGMYSSNGDMHINLGTPSQYAVTLDFRRHVSSQTGCSTQYPGECFPYRNDLVTLTTLTEVQSRLVDAAGNDRSGGLLSLAPGEVAFARLRFDFRDGAGLLWRVRFNKLDFAGSSDVRVTRDAGEPCTWVFEAESDDAAGVWTSKVPAGQRKAVRIDYGLFYMPGQITVQVFDAPGCPPKSW